MDALSVLQRIGAALDAAHRKGLIHRDVKPANILFDEWDDAFLSDFGIVKLGQESFQLTGSGVIGTPSYMAPEMLEKRGLTKLIDVYALGVTLYEMLAGRTPFEADTPQAIILAHLAKPIPDIRQLRPDLPPAVTDVINKGMAKDPTERYQNPEQLTKAFEQAIIMSSNVVDQETTASVIEPTVNLYMDSTTSLSSKKEEISTTEKHRKFVPFTAIVAGLVALASVLIGGVLLLTGVIDISGVEVEPTSDQESATDQSLETSEEIPSELQIALDPVGRNADWEPYTQEFNGVEMALVPSGCFMMGSTGGDQDEQPIHEVCFEQPFWIDVYEVTNQQYGETGCADELQQPRDCISWEEASSYCESRQARLPTEAEWEYAARGPDNLIYPWGNEFIAENTVFAFNSDGESTTIGSREGGVSWVGAYDMSGNVWEWVSDWYDDEYYSNSPRINPQGPNNGTSHVWRGGSWGAVEFSLRTADRAGSESAFTGLTGGFRCARSSNIEIATNNSSEQNNQNGGVIESNATLEAEELTQQGVEQNEDWSPYIQTFDGVEMALVPAGCFMMGSEVADDSGGRDEQPSHEICFEEPYWIDVFEVTNAQYGTSDCEYASFEPEQPRICINWFEANTHCEERDARLPTEAEWEYVARGPTGLLYPWGNQFVEGNVVFSGSQETQTAPVGSREAGISWVGTYDMSGNVWEWVSDWYDSEYYSNSPFINPQGPSDGNTHVLRGGSYNGPGTSGLRATNRIGSVPDYSSADTGFRCAKSYQD